MGFFVLRVKASSLFFWLGFCASDYAFQGLRLFDLKEVHRYIPVGIPIARPITNVITAFARSDFNMGFNFWGLQNPGFLFLI